MFMPTMGVPGAAACNSSRMPGRRASMLSMPGKRQLRPSVQGKSLKPMSMVMKASSSRCSSMKASASASWLPCSYWHRPLSSRMVSVDSPGQARLSSCRFGIVPARHEPELVGVASARQVVERVRADRLPACSHRITQGEIPAVTGLVAHHRVISRPCGQRQRDRQEGHHQGSHVPPPADTFQPADLSGKCHPTPEMEPDEGGACTESVEAPPPESRDRPSG